MLNYSIPKYCSIGFHGFFPHPVPLLLSSQHQLSLKLGPDSDLEVSNEFLGSFELKRGCERLHRLQVDLQSRSQVRKWEVRQLVVCVKGSEPGSLIFSLKPVITLSEY